MLSIKNPIYIENYGYTFNDPSDFGYLVDFYGSKDTSESLFINGSTLDNYVDGVLLSSYQLKLATRENYKPLYYESSVIIDDNKVKAYLYNYRDTLGKNIHQDYRLIRWAISDAKPSTLLTPDPRTGNNSSSSDMLDFWSGYSMSGLFNGNKW